MMPSAFRSLSLFAKGTYNNWLISRRFPDDGRLRDDGIGIVAETEYVCSLSQLARDFIDKMSQTGLSFRLINSSFPFVKHPAVKQDESNHFKQFESDIFDQRHVLHFSTIRCGKDKRYCNAITPFWEFQSGMLEFRPGLFDGADVVIAYSDFLRDYYETVVPNGVKILKFTYPYVPCTNDDFDLPMTRQRFGIPESAFVVFFNFDFNSCYERKNPDAVIRAFSRAFGAHRDEAFLVFKTSHATDHPAERSALDALALQLGVRDKLCFIDEYLSRRDVLALTAASNAYISLHRGEGLGMGMLEAMSLRVPVVATDYGGNTDFVRQETAFPVPYRMVTVRTSEPAYRYVSQWAEPDVDAAADSLRKLYQDGCLAQGKADAAQSFVAEHFNLVCFKDEINTFLKL